MGFEEEAVVQLINSDFRDLSVAANQLANHVVKLGGIGFGASFFGLIAAIAAMYVLFLFYLLLPYLLYLSVITKFLNSSLNFSD